jgi:hypothetical protein
VAMEIFTDKYGFNPMMNLVSTSGAEWKQGVTEGAYDFENTHADWFETFEATAYYLRPDRDAVGEPGDPDYQEGDPFYYEAWADQFNEGTRTPKPLSEQVDEYVYRMASLEYRKGKKEIEEGVASGDIQVPEGVSQEAFIRATLQELDQGIKQTFPDYEAQKGNFTDEKRKTQILELKQWSEHSDIASSDTGKAVGGFFEVWDEFEVLQREARGTVASTLPFKNSNSKIDPTPGSSWYTRMALNVELIQLGNQIAADPDSGNFATVWEEVIRPTIYDYTQDVGMNTSDPAQGVEDERRASEERLLTEWGL